MSFFGWLKTKVFGPNGFDMSTNDKEVKELKEEAKEHWAIQGQAAETTRISFEDLKNADRWEHC